MENSYFVFAPNNGYMYSSPKRWKGDNLVASLTQFIGKEDVANMLWGAFGPGEENCYFAWKTSDGKTLNCWGDNAPPAMIKWLKENEMDEHVRCTLGPNESFFIWDSKSIMWQNIPRGLEQAVLSWLGPAGWTNGPPRIVTLGAEGSYFALSEYGAAAWEVDPGLKNAHRAFVKMKEEVTAEQRKYSDLEYVNISSCDNEHFLYVWNDMTFVGDVPDPTEKWCEVFEDLLDEDRVKEWRQNRKEVLDEEKKQRKAEEMRKEKERKAREKAGREEAARQERAREAEELTLQYVLWRTAWEADIQHKKLLTVFPHLPRKVCTCVEVSCVLRKMDTALLACQHDVERFLRASESYSVAWLRKERLMWHPDKFGQRCDIDFRKELKRKATEMYAIYEVLIAQEVGDTGD